MARQYALLLVLATGLMGHACTAQMVTTRRNLSTDPNAPQATGPDDGEIKYLNEGIQSVREARRRDAYSRMKEYCNGHYRITSESEASEQPTYFGLVKGPGNVIRIKFECLQGSGHGAETPSP